MGIRSLAVIVCIALGLVNSQAPDGYTKVADNDFVDAGPMTVLRQDITTTQACADACSQDGQCQAFLITNICWLYRLRRCMTPPKHDNVVPQSELGPIYEKNSPIQIPGDSQIVTVCGNYSGSVISSTVSNIPNSPSSVNDRLAFTKNCSQSCATQTGPNCHSWRVLQIFENNPHVPIELRCTLYADSIYDVDNSRGFISVLNGACKRAQSIYGINGPATSFLNCARPAPGTGADPGAPVGSSVIGGGSNNGTTGGDSGIVTAPGASSSQMSSAPDSMRSSMSSGVAPPPSPPKVMSTAPVVGADVQADGKQTSVSMASGTAPIVVLFVFLKVLLGVLA